MQNLRYAYLSSCVENAKLVVGSVHLHRLAVLILKCRVVAMQKPTCHQPYRQRYGRRNRSEINIICCK